MVKNTCSVCGAKNSLVKETKKITVRYGATELTKELPVIKCSCCGAKFDPDNKNDKIRKAALVEVRQNSVVENLSNVEKDISFVDLERCFSLPSKKLSKWKNKSKAPSAAAAALINLIGVFPWLSYVAINNYDSATAYKIAGAAFFKKAIESEKVSAFYTANNFYETVGLVNSKTSTLNENLIDENLKQGQNLFAGEMYDCK